VSVREVFRPKIDVRFRRVAEEGVVLLQDAGEVLALNEVGARILELIDDGLAVPAIVDRLFEEFEADRAALGADTADFVGELLESGVIETVPATEEKLDDS